ncbi:MAG TPA: trehalose-6-phosphate synthase, partial [Vicinamibacteria bacterium]
MRRAVRFVIALVVALGLLVWAGSAIVQQTTRAWFERDIDLRVQLVFSGARQALVAHWHKETRSALQALLTEIARDERIMA